MTNFETGIRAPRPIRIRTGHLVVGLAPGREAASAALSFNFSSISARNLDGGLFILLPNRNRVAECVTISRRSALVMPT